MKNLIIIAAVWLMNLASFGQDCKISAGKYKSIFSNAKPMRRVEFRSRCSTSDTTLLLAYILDDNRYEFRSRVPGGEYVLQATPDIDYFEIAYFSDAQVIMRERFYLDGTRIPEYSIGNWFRNRDDLDKFLKDAFGIVIL